MKRYAIYSISSGAIERVVQCNANAAALQAGDGEAVIEVGADAGDLTHHIEAGALVPGRLDRRSLQQRKAEKWAQIKAQRDTLEAAGFPYLGAQFDSDPRSVQRINTAVQAAQAALGAGQPFAIEWTAADNTAVALDAAQMLGMPVALAVYANTLHQTARALRDQIDAATTPEAVEAIAWNAT